MADNTQTPFRTLESIMADLTAAQAANLAASLANIASRVAEQAAPQAASLAPRPATPTAVPTATSTSSTTTVLREPWMTLGWDEQAARNMIEQSPTLREIMELPQLREVVIHDSFPTRFRRNLTKDRLMAALMQSRGWVNVYECGKCMDRRKVPFINCVSCFHYSNGACASHVWFKAGQDCGHNQRTGADRDPQKSYRSFIVVRENEAMLRNIAARIGQPWIALQWGTSGILTNVQLVTEIRRQIAPDPVLNNQDNDVDDTESLD